MANLRRCWLALLAALVTGHLEAQGPGPFPAPAALPCAGPNVVPEAVQGLATQVAEVTRAFEAGEAGLWRPLRDLAEAACLAGDRATLAAAYERCVRECRDAGDRYLAHLDFAGALERFGDAAGAEREYLAAIALRPGRPPEAIEAYNRYALLLDRQGRPQDALALLERFTPEERGVYSFTASLRLWVMRELGMNLAGEPAPVPPPLGFADVLGPPPRVSPLALLPGQIDLRPIEPMAIEVQGEVVVGPPRSSPAARGRLEFTRMGTRDRMFRPGEVKLVRGEVFIVVAELGPDGCRIAHGPATYDLVACPWRSSSSDRQRDLYRVLGRRETERAVADAAAAVPAAPVFSPFAESAAAPGPTEADAWRGLYSSVDAAARARNRTPSETLAERTGLSATDSAAVMTAAREFMAALEAIDEAARSEIAARFGGPPPPGIGALLPGGGRMPRTLVPATTPDGRSVQVVLAGEGFMTRVAGQKAEALGAHRGQLSAMLGPAKLAALVAALPEITRAPSAPSGPAVLLAEREPRTVRTSVADATIVAELAPELEAARLGGTPNAQGPSVTEYRFERDFDRDGRLDLVLLGRHSGGRTFALIASLEGDVWRRAALFSFLSPELQRRGDLLDVDRLAVAFCASCDVGGWLERDAGGYVFRAAPSGERRD